MSDTTYTPGCFGFPAQELWTEPLRLMQTEVKPSWMTTDVIAQMRRCWKCQDIKSLQEFHQDVTQAQGRKHDCKSCHNAMERERTASKKVAT